jgi:hypothetical protein
MTTPISSVDYQLMRDALASFASFYYGVRHKPDSTELLKIGGMALTVGDLRAAAEAYNHQPVRVALVRRSGA